MAKILIYGAYGYTGELISKEAQEQGLDVILSGRNADKLAKIAKETSFKYETVDLNDHEGLLALLSKVEVVIHCAGPFQHTAKQMINACLKAKTHYLDITGEYQVFDMVHTRDQEAKDRGVMLLPGSGFDVVPSDCLAAHLKSQLPEATKLDLAFTSTGGSMSRGTSKTAIEGAGQGQMYRENGTLKNKPQGRSTRIVDYGPTKRISVGISWGDISSAYYSTGIPNIEVFTGSSEKQINKLRWMHRLRFLLKVGWVKNFLRKQIDKKPAGPSEGKRAKSQMYLWGRATADSKTKEARLVTPNGYTLTSKTAILFATKIINGKYTPGYQTPSTAYGKDVILEIDGSSYL